MNAPGADAPSPNESRGDLLRLGLLLLAVGADQWTKYLARRHFSLPGGMPDYFKVERVVGEWIQFRLVYNPGAAFGLRPQNYLPFLHPTLFYAVLSLVAAAALVFYYRKLGGHEPWQKTGVALILSGAFGNLIDRLALHKVTDFIDAGVPGMAARWPTFNLADSCICVGAGLVLGAPWLFRKPRPSVAAPAAAASAPEPLADPQDIHGAGNP